MKRFLKGLVMVVLFVMVPVVLLAETGGGLPFEGPMTKILNTITGPWLRFGVIVAIIVLSLAVAFGEVQGIFKKAIYVVLGLSIACGAVSWGIGFFNFTGGLGF